MKQLILLLLSTIIITIISCDNENNRCMKRSGEITTFNENLSNFSKISINSNFDVKLKQSTNYSISITAGKNLIPYVEYNISRGELSLRNNNRCNWLRDYSQVEVIISFPEIKEISITEACNLSSIDTLKISKLIIDNRAGILNSDLTINCDSLEFRAHASTGNYRFFGEVNYAYIYNIGNGYIFSHNMKCKTMHIVHKSLGRSIIHVTDLLMIENIEHGIVELRFGCPYISFNSYEFKDRFEDNPVCQ